MPATPASRPSSKNGWFRPLDDLWAKYRDEFKLDDFPEAVRKTYTHDGQLYVMPHTLNTMMFFYRKDLFDAAGKAAPKTIAEYRDLAKSLNSPMRSGNVSCLKPVDAAINEAHWYFNALGDGWFDKDWHPVFNDAKGVQAIEMMKQIAQYAQQGFTAAANDECMIAYQQDTGDDGPAMGDPRQGDGRSGEVACRSTRSTGWRRRRAMRGTPATAMPSPRSASRTPNVLFRIIATSASQANMRGAASLLIPPRKSLLDDAGTEAGEPVLSGGAGVV